ncbi:MAG: hypothetical protein Ct9H300mP3_08090 [Gammaproteobacteria bacterium]|nr:MAG: hypothetical protein Ct9H300mP3_08090 [Gammaproteobacteria bacterium]
MDTSNQSFWKKKIKKLKNLLLLGLKRGWTTWTPAGVDDRVEAIVPVVIDLLNLKPSFEHHWSVYGFWAPAIQDMWIWGLLIGGVLRK